MLLCFSFGENCAMKTETIHDVFADGFVLDSEANVNRVLQHLANLAAERERVTAQARALIAALENEERALRYRHEDGLKAFAVRKMKEQGGRRKSVILLQGTLAFRSLPRRVTLAEEADAFRFAQQNDWQDAMTTITQLDREKYLDHATRHLEKTGEKLPGIDIVPERESFSIRFGKVEE
jgi:hypothetical protein